VKVEEVRAAMGDGFGFLLALGIGPSDYFQLQLVCGLQIFKRKSLNNPLNYVLWNT
jgi:hypothetical protein